MITERPFTVYGYWADNTQRYAEAVTAVTAREAERRVQVIAHEERAELCVCAVVEGEVPTVDMYTLYINPHDERNRTTDGLELPEEHLEPVTFTVLGVVKTHHKTSILTRQRWQALLSTDVDGGGERYADQVEATSASWAEDVARDRVSDLGGELLVCAVVEGAVYRVDSYATFVDPEVEVIVP